LIIQRVFRNKVFRPGREISELPVRKGQIVGPARIWASQIQVGKQLGVVRLSDIVDFYAAMRLSNLLALPCDYQDISTQPQGIASNEFRFDP
jgi:hypothetical protein